MNCEEKIRGESLNKINLCGGTSMFRFIKERLDIELKSIFSPNFNFQIKCNEERKYASWIGGSIFASLDLFKKALFTRSEYQERGKEIVNTKCSN